MEKIIENLLITRQNILRVVQDLSDEKINKIPEGFSNNLIWNIGHVLVTFQLLIYGLSGLKMNVSESDIARFRKGTKPISIITDEEANVLKSQFIEHVKQLKLDVGNNKFSSFQVYDTSYGVKLTTAKEAIEFIGLHEAMHLGSMIALKKFI